jgi:hypothetical protein
MRRTSRGVPGGTQFWEKWNARHDRRMHPSLHIHMSIRLFLFPTTAPLLRTAPTLVLARPINTFRSLHCILNLTVPTSYCIFRHSLAMDNPTEEITGVVHKLCQGSPAEQVRHQSRQHSLLRTDLHLSSFRPKQSMPISHPMPPSRILSVAPALSKAAAI